MKIDILCTDQNHPVVSHLRNWIEEFKFKGHEISLVFNKVNLSGGDILFLVSCADIIRECDRSIYKTVLVLHASDLPMGRGWSPHIWAVINGESNITVTLLEASEPVDSGRIFLKTMFSLEGHELLPEINSKLFSAELMLMSKVVDNFKEIRPINQIGDPGPYYAKRTPKNSEINPEKTIADQFDLLRTIDSERYPAFFYYRGKRYLIKIEKDQID